LASWVVELNPLKSREDSSDAPAGDSPNLSALRIAGFYATLESLTRPKAESFVAGRIVEALCRLLVCI
jgi:hypothetical protein